MLFRCHCLPAIPFLLGLAIAAAPCWRPLAAQQVERPTADLVVLEANVVQCDPNGGQAAAVAVNAGRIVAVGPSEEVHSWIGDKTRVIQAEGQTLTPGLIDSHLHFVGLGQSLQMLDLRDAKSWKEIVQQVERASRSLPDGTWIEGRGWHQSKWTTEPDEDVDGYPVHTSMSKAVPRHPVLLTHASGHACFANAAAMRAAGVDPHTSDPPGGEILKDGSGRPIGVFRENAQALVRRAKARAAQRMTEEERMAQLKEQIRLAGDACLQHGITSVHDAGSSFADARRFRQLAESRQLPVRLIVMIREGRPVLEAQMPTSRWIDVGDGFLTVRSVKVSVDGALGPHGAWLLRAYSDLPGQRGLNTFALDELEGIARLCREHRWQLCVHAIGDRANREVLDIYEETLGDGIHTDHRWRIEHAQHLAVEDIPRFGQLGVIPAMQANHCTSDAPFVPIRLGERRSAEGAYVWRSLIDSGAIVPNGTDAPVERVDPRVSLYAAVTRQLSNGDAFYPEQCMTRLEALLSYTYWPARAAFQERELGSIEVGKRADMVLWDTNLLTCPPEKILDAQVTHTIQQGVVVFQHNE